MRSTNKIEKINLFFVILTAIFLALGATGIFRETILLFGTIFAIILLGFNILYNGVVLFPKYFFLYLISIAILYIHSFITGGNMSFFYLFASGGFFLIAFKNFEPFNKYYVPIILILGLLMGVAYAYSSITNFTLPILVSLFSPGTNLIKHSNIGDLWAIIIVLISYEYLFEHRKIYLPFIFIGLFFLFLSLSRAAYLSASLGILYFIYRKGLSKEVKKFLTYFLIGIVLLFIYASFFKTTIFDRPFFLDAILGFIKNPLGIGMGGLEKIPSTSNLTHNILLELLLGIGIFSIPFFVYFYKIIKDLFIRSDINLKYAAGFIAIFVDFMFNTTYVIPTMIWIFFIFLAVSTI